MISTRHLEALLFVKAEPQRCAALAKALGIDTATLEHLLTQLTDELASRGVALLRTHDTVMLTTAPDMTELVEKVQREELEKDLGKAGLETFTIVLYRGPVTRSEIDYIRGVNSTYTLRALLIRGLIERVTNPKDARAYAYQPTVKALTHLGVTRVEELPDYEQITQDITSFEERIEDDETTTIATATSTEDAA